MSLEPSYCKKCGKEFYPTPMHVYRDSTGTYCCWTCFSHRRKKKPASNAKKVEQYLDDEPWKTFSSATEAAKYIGGLPAGIRKACLTGTKYKCFFWRYKQ